MLILKQGFAKKEKRVIEQMLYDTVDLYGDFYVTKDNIRIYLRDNPDILFSYLNKGDRWVYDESSDKGVAVITGWSDKSPRKYVKLLTKDVHLAGNLLKMINWNVKTDVYAKIKKNNPLLKVFQSNQYAFVGNRGSEVLLMRKYIARPEQVNQKDEEYYDRIPKKKI